MSRIAQKEDLCDPDVIAAFAARVGNERRLTALYLLTVADIRGTSPKVWNAWKGKLLEDLYRLDAARARRRAAEPRRRDRGAQARGAAAAAACASLPGTAHEAAVGARSTLSYFVRHDAGEIAWHTRSLDRPRRHRRRRSCARALSPVGEGLQVLVYTPDQPRPVRAHLRLLRQAGFNILDAKVHTTHQRLRARHLPGRQPARSPDHYRDLIAWSRPSWRWRSQATGPAARAEPRPDLAPGQVASRSTPRVTLRPDERAQRWLLGVSASDRSGLLYAIARVLAQPQHQPAAGQDHDARRAGRGHLPDRRPGAAAEQAAAADRDRDARRDQRLMKPHAPCVAAERGRWRSAAGRHGAADLDASSAAAFERHHRRALRERIRARPPAGRRELAVARRRRARARSAPSTSRCSPFDARRSAAPRWSPATSPGTSSATCSTCRATGRRWSTAGAAASAAARSAWCSGRSAFGSTCWRAATRRSAAPSSPSSTALPARFDFRVVCGTTGSGKSRLLRALAARGEQVLDLEALADHRGSVLGLVPGDAQPSQKAFDTAVWDALRRLDPARTGVRREREQEDRRPARAGRRWSSACGPRPASGSSCRLDARVALLLRRVRLLRRGHRCLLRPARCAARAARPRDGRRLAGGGARRAASSRSCASCWSTHYDPIYLQSMRRNFPAMASPLARIDWDGGTAGLQAAAVEATAAATSGPA